MNPAEFLIFVVVMFSMPDNQFRAFLGRSSFNIEDKSVRTAYDRGAFDKPLLIGIIVMFLVPKDDFSSSATTTFDIEDKIREVLDVNESIMRNNPFLIVSVVPVFFVPQADIQYLLLLLLRAFCFDEGQNLKELINI